MRAMIALTSAAALLVACGDGDGTGPSEADSWMPLSVGNVWNAQIEGWAIGATEQDTIDVTGTIDRRVTDLLDHQGGFQVHLLESLMEFNLSYAGSTWVERDTSVIYLRETEEGLLNYPDTVSTDYELFLSYPLVVAEEWQEQPGSTVYYEVITLSAYLNVPYGAFDNCALVRERDTAEPGWYWDHYLHRGTGMVRDVTEMPGGMMLDMKLTELVVN